MYILLEMKEVLEFAKSVPDIVYYLLVAILSFLFKTLWPSMKNWWRKVVSYRRNRMMIKSITTDMMIKTLLIEMRISALADRAIVMQIHNGMDFVNSHFHKFYASCTFEAAMPGLTLEREKFQRLPLSLFGTAIINLLDREVLAIEEVKKSENSGFRSLVTNYDVKNIFLIKLTNRINKFTGFIVLYYSDMSKYEESSKKLDLIQDIKQRISNNL